MIKRNKNLVSRILGIALMAIFVLACSNSPSGDQGDNNGGSNNGGDFSNGGNSSNSSTNVIWSGTKDLGVDWSQSLTIEPSAFDNCSSNGTFTLSGTVSDSNAVIKIWDGWWDANLDVSNTLGDSDACITFNGSLTFNLSLSDIAIVKQKGMVIQGIGVVLKKLSYNGNGSSSGENSDDWNNGDDNGDGNSGDYYEDSINAPASVIAEYHTTGGLAGYISISWDEVKNAEKYGLYYNDSADESTAKFFTFESGTWSLIEFEPSAWLYDTMYLWVSAYSYDGQESSKKMASVYISSLPSSSGDSNGDSSGGNTSGSITELTVPKFAPYKTDNKPRATNNNRYLQFLLDEDCKDTNVERYELHRADGVKNGTYKKVGQISGSTSDLWITDEDLNLHDAEPNKTFYYKLIAVKGKDSKQSSQCYKITWKDTAKITENVYMEKGTSSKPTKKNIVVTFYPIDSDYPTTMTFSFENKGSATRMIKSNFINAGTYNIFKGKDDTGLCYKTGFKLSPALCYCTSNSFGFYKEPLNITMKLENL